MESCTCSCHQRFDFTLSYCGRCYYEHDHTGYATSVGAGWERGWPIPDYVPNAPGEVRPRQPLPVGLSESGTIVWRNEPRTAYRT